MSLLGRVLGERAARQLARSPSFRVGAALVVALLVLALVVPLVVGDPNASDFAHGIAQDGSPGGPTARHLLGTDNIFRDELARLAHGARLSLAIAVFATGISTALGALVGIVSGYYAGRAVDTIAMRVVDVLLSFPYLLLVMAIGAALERTSALTVLLVLGLTSWLGTARLVRAKTLEVREKGFVEAARALGLSEARLLLRHVLPNVVSTLVVVSTVSMSTMILAESVLSYLQVGVQPPTATWGRMLFEGQASMTLTPRLVALPGLFILASVLGFNLLGEGLRDALDQRSVR